MSAQTEHPFAPRRPRAPRAAPDSGEGGRELTGAARPSAARIPCPNRRHDLTGATPWT